MVMDLIDYRNCYELPAFLLTIIDCDEAPTTIFEVVKIEFFGDINVTEVPPCLKGTVYPRIQLIGAVSLDLGYCFALTTQ